jgi:hypothetical protein
LPPEPLEVVPPEEAMRKIEPTPFLISMTSRQFVAPVCLNRKFSPPSRRKLQGLERIKLTVDAACSCHEELAQLHPGSSQDASRLPGPESCFFPPATLVTSPFRFPVLDVKHTP